MEKLKRKISFKAYLIALLITLIFFSFGILVGKYFAYQQLDTLRLSQKAISAFFSLFELRGAILNKTAYCNLSWSDLWKEKVEIGEILTELELRLGKTNKRVIEQKIIYNEVQFKTLKLAEKVNKECRYNWTLILFFYTNNKKDKKGDYELSELQGYVLDTIYEIDREKIKIFSFDINALDNETQKLIANYSIKSVPSLVINKKLYEGFRSKYEIQKIIGK